MPTFNVAYEPWIPCLLNAASIPQELGLFDTLVRADEIREISDDSPLVTVAIHRLLLAILHRNFGPASFSEWKKLWQQGKWDGGRLANYFRDWSEKGRFDLFDEKRPFYQTLRMQKSSTNKRKPGNSQQQKNASGELMEDMKSHPVALLAEELASGNNATLFDHSFEDSPLFFSCSEVTRFLLSRQAFAFAGTGGYLNSPLVGGYTVLVLGANLFETLALNLLVYNSERPIPHQGTDLPCWEQENPKEPDKDGTLPRGYLDYLTWESRRIHLFAEGEPVRLRYCQHSQNLKVKDERGDIDPFRCYEQGGKGVFRAKRVNPARALWRDSHALFQQSDDSSRRPQVFNHIAQIDQARLNGEINARAGYRFCIYGMVNDQASVSMWSCERLPLPLAYLSDPELTSELEEALKLTDKFADNLNDAIKTLARNLVGTENAANLAKSFAAEEFYWSRLEAPFKKLLVDLAEEFSRDQETRDSLRQWANTVSDTASKALQHTVNGLSGAARQLKAAAFAESEFARRASGTRKAFARFFVETN
ncbi:type I-E CRISPR-associated protein Cse1/CasA [bacterium]|nr:type I-E CRISPR-associated protein Cse1/CasA [bacterium]